MDTGRMNLMVDALLALTTLSAIEMDLLRSRVEACDPASTTSYAKP
jgi:hypothetical protein